jgi:co-chaperonin GroES (HSP10)
MKKLKATCDRILAQLPPALKGEKIIGGIVIPEAAKLNEHRGLTELLIVSAGPDCKVAKPGLYVLVAKAVCQPLDYEGVEYMVFSEVTAVAIIEKTPEPVAISIPSPEQHALTIADIKAGLGMKDEKPIDDQSALPVEAAPSA